MAINKNAGIVRVSATKFFNVVENVKSQNVLVGAMLGDYSIKDLQKMQCYLTKDNKCGYAIKNGDLVNVFSLIKGKGKDLVVNAIRKGAVTLDCFDGFLPNYYAQFGFVEVKREENWTVGGPDVVYMRLA